MKERRVNDDRKTSRCLRTTVSAHHVVFPSISSSVCRSLSFLFSGSIQISPRLSSSFFSSLLLFLTTPSLPPYVSFFPLAVNTPLLIFLFLQLSLFSYALVPVQKSFFFFVRINQSIRTSTQTYYHQHIHINAHTAPHTHKKNSNTENMQQNSLQCSWVYLCVLICRMPGWPHQRWGMQTKEQFKML